MSAQQLARVGVIVAAVMLACLGLTGALLTSAGLGTPVGCVIATNAAGPSGTAGGAFGGSRPVDGWDTEQVSNAAAITTVGRDLGVPRRGWVIAVATAMRESNLRNLGDLGPDNDHDSLGLFQQRPSQGWGTPAQLLEPGYAAAAFYRRLLTVSGWQAMALTDAAQAVQRSAHPDAYAAWEARATRLVSAVGPAVARWDPGDPWQNVSGPALGRGCFLDGVDGAVGSLPAGFVVPVGTPPAVAAALWWALAQLGTPYSFGGDCTAARSGNPARQCDCSSLVQMAYRAGGVRLPRTTSELVHIGASVRGMTDLRVGDLVFIPGSDGTPANPRHVGLYIGQGLLVQAPQTGDLVKISSLSSWSEQIAAIRRPVA